MHDKIGRNDPCPCGSGKKYKKCCLDSIPDIKTENDLSQEEVNNLTLNYIKQHESSHQLNLLTGIQLIPENHGKNIRIEELSKLILQNLNDNQHSDEILFAKCIKKEFSENYLEDIPENLFTENVLFFEGNYTAFPGISSYSIEIFKYLTESIFIFKNTLPDKFKSHIYQGISVILEFGQHLVRLNNPGLNIYEQAVDTEIQFLNREIDFSQSMEDLDKLLRPKGINPAFINDFILRPEDPKFYDPEEEMNPLLYYPIVLFKNRYYFLLLSNQVNALNEYIFRTSKKYECESVLLKSYHERIWHDVKVACNNMNWALTKLILPKLTVPDDVFFKENVFIFDTNRLAYVYYTSVLSIEELYSSSKSPSSHLTFHEERKAEIVSFLKAQKDFEHYKFLSLSTFGSVGRDVFLLNEEPVDREFTLSLPAFEFILLASSEEWNHLGLWKFAKVYHGFLKSTKGFFHSFVDSYNMYKSHNQSFYLTDKKRPDFMTFVPGEGSKLIRDIKINQNSHGVLFLIDTIPAYITVCRTRDFAPFFEPVSQIEYYTMLLEGYSIPIWISCRQANKKVKVSIAKLYIEAIGFWLFKLTKALYDVIKLSNKLPLEFQLEFDESYFNLDIEREVVNADVSSSPYSSSFHDHAIKFYLHSSSRSSFKGSTNKGERDLIYAILQSFNHIPGIHLTEDFIETSLNEQMPFGNAKMILLIDSQKDLLIDGRWLVPKLFLTEAEINILLDELPSLLEIEQTIPAEIMDPAEKVTFFNNATIVLLNKLFAEIQVFDYSFLLDRLINIHETLVREREFNKTLVPAQILCFSSIQLQIDKIIGKENNLVTTSLAIRCLIEYIAATHFSGHTYASYDDIDRLLAIMHEILSYGYLSDTIHFKMDNPKVGKLASGRIGITSSFFYDKLKPFSTASAQEDIDTYLDDFVNRFDVFYPDINPKGHISEPDKEYLEIDDAFLNDWGISFTSIIKFCNSCAILCLEIESSIITISEGDLIKKLTSDHSIPHDEVISGIRIFSISNRPIFLKAPDGYKDSEVFPWKYNREFSFASIIEKTNCATNLKRIV